MNTFRHFALGLTVALLFACEDKRPEPVEVIGAIELNATVVSVDVDDRMIEFEGDDGSRLLTSVDPDVRNLAQVEAGDTLTVRYQSGYALEMAEPGESEWEEAESDTEPLTVQAEEGRRPYGAVGATTRTTVEILSVEEDGRSVSFRDSEGRSRSVQVNLEDVQDFAKHLKQGDRVSIEYAEALTVSIEQTDPDS